MTFYNIQKIEFIDDVPNYDETKISSHDMESYMACLVSNFTTIEALLKQIKEDWEENERDINIASKQLHQTILHSCKRIYVSVPYPLTKTAHLSVELKEQSDLTLFDLYNIHSQCYKMIYQKEDQTSQKEEEQKSITLFNR